MNYLIIVFVCGKFIVADTSRHDPTNPERAVASVLLAYGPHNPIRSILWFEDPSQVEAWIDSMPGPEEVPDDVTIH